MERRKKKKKQWSKNKKHERKRVRSVEEETKHIWHLLYLNYSNVYSLILQNIHPNPPLKHVLFFILFF